METNESGSIESIADVLWGQYEGDVEFMHLIENSNLPVSTEDLMHDVLRGNYVEGFRQGVLLRLTGGMNDGHG